MFKKLKEKITEEVKISPQRFQQLTQSVSDKLQGTSAPDENMFSIGEDDKNDNPSTASMPDQGFSSVSLVSPTSENKSRRMSTSSMASDVSFLPRYEPASFYHLQSDLDASASELEDNISQSSSKLGNVSKEQILSAFQKSQTRYHKYRGRYTDLARHYKELEKENAKIKAVLVDTQDKAIRRANELKEQCSLEKDAKAHLESALRDELDEKQMKIQSLETTIGLLQHGNSQDTLIDIDRKGDGDNEKLEQFTKYLNDARNEIEALNSKIQEYKASAIVFQSREIEYKTVVAGLEKSISELSEREKENNLILAKNKMDLHNELLNKESEISKLKKEIVSLRTTINSQEKDNKSVKIENLQNQNGKLIEKVENLTQKCNGFENELLKVEKYKLDIKELNKKNVELTKMVDEEKEVNRKFIEENDQLQNVIAVLKNGLSLCQENLKRLGEEKQILIETVQTEKQTYETQIEELREGAKQGLFKLEKLISDRMYQNYKEKETQLKLEFEQKIKEISLNNESLADTRLQLIEKDHVINDLSNRLGDAENELIEKDELYRELEQNHLGLIDECNQLRNSATALQKQVTQFQNNVKNLEEELEKLEKMCGDKEKQNVLLAKEILNFQTTNVELLQKCRLLEEHQETVEMETTENNLLEMKVQTLEQEKQSLLNSFESERKLFNKVMEEHNEAKIKDIVIGELEERNKKLVEKVTKLKDFIKEKEKTIVEVNKLKLQLEQELSKAKEAIRVMEEREEAIDMDKTECDLLKIKVQKLEHEKDSLIKSFERERESFDQSFHNKDAELVGHKEELRTENLVLAKDNLELKKINNELFEKVRIFEERAQAIELETSACNLLKLKLQELEHERDDLLKNFEAERVVFNKVLLEHKELKIKNEKIKDLEDSNQRLTEKVSKLKEYLKKKEENIVKLQKDNLAKEQETTKLQETLQIKQEQINSLEIEKSECGLLELKVKSLKEKNKNLLDSFEVERKSFEQALSKGSHIENQIDKLNRHIIQLEEANSEMENSFSKEKQDLLNTFEIENKKSQISHGQLQKLREEIVLLKEEKDNLNSKLKKETEILNGQINLLKEEVSRLQESNDNLTKDLETRQSRIEDLNNVISQLHNETEQYEERRKKMSEALKSEEKQKKDALAKLKSMQEELDKNNSEISEIKRALQSVEKLYEEAKNKQSGDGELLDETRRKLNDMENEKIRLDNELRKKSDEFNFKAKEMVVIEQQFSIVTHDKECLVQENKQLKEKMDGISRECDNLKPLTAKVKQLDQFRKQNEALQIECDRLNQEISELKVRLNQLSSDNKNINEEHDKLVEEVEGFKAKCEFLENEKGSFEKSRSVMEWERDELQAEVTTLTNKLQNRDNHRSLEATTSNNVDLVQIQQDFLDLKGKCDKLHIENTNLKSEYAKVEDQCNSFSRVKKDLENKLIDHERHFNEVLHEKQLLQDEVHELKISPISSNSKLDNLATVRQEMSMLSLNRGESDLLTKEIEHLREKLSQYHSLDVTNKSSIEFYEHELQKMKTKNEKLNRKLDETLVTLNHCAELSSSTEIEYLRNILYNYMLGKESLVLARVIAAVCKFDQTQTEAVLQKEQQKQTVLGLLGIL